VPVENTPVSNEPLSARAECGIPSSFVHEMESPTFTVTLAGTNCAVRIATPALAACAAVALESASATAATAAANANVRRRPAIRSVG